MTTVRIGVVGSRRRNSQEDKETVFKAIAKAIEDACFDQEHPNDVEFMLVSGGCKVYNRSTKKYEGCGADYFAELFAQEYGVSILIHYPQYHRLPENPKRWDFAHINYARNTLIARDSDYLVACVAADRTGGTEDTITKFKKFGKERNLFLC